MIELMTVEEVAQIIRSSKWFVYKNWRKFGGVRFGKLIRFPKEAFETKVKEVIDGSLQVSEGLALSLLEARNETQQERIQDKAGSSNRGSGSQKKPKKDEFKLHRLMREQT